jgi:hypothetical protein
VRDSLSPPIISKKGRFKALLASRFIPEVTADDVEETMKNQ